MPEDGGFGKPWLGDYLSGVYVLVACPRGLVRDPALMIADTLAQIADTTTAPRHIHKGAL